jgi:hypothetical protein
MAAARQVAPKLATFKWVKPEVRTKERGSKEAEREGAARRAFAPSLARPAPVRDRRARHFLHPRLDARAG